MPTPGFYPRTSHLVTLFPPKFRPVQIPNCLLWLDAADPTTLCSDTGCTTPVATNGAAVQGWRDKSGNGYNATQATSADAPTLSIAAINGKSALAFNGSTQFLDLGTVLGRPANWSIFATAILNSATARGEIIGSTAPGGGGQHSWGSLDFNAGSAATFSYLFGDDTNFTQNYTANYAIPIGSPFLIECEFTDGLNSALSYLNGSVLATPNTYGQTAYHCTGTVYDAAIGRIGPVSTYYWTGSIAEIIVYNRPLDDTERKLVEAYLRGRWGTP